MLQSADPQGSHLAKLSPFELKDQLIKLAQAANAQGAATTPFLNAGRGNPNWIATTPREAFVRLTEFALSECKRDWDEPGLGGMPQRVGIASRLREFIAREGAGNPGTRLLAASLDYGVNLLGFDADLRRMTAELVKGHTSYADIDAYLEGYAITGTKMATLAIPSVILIADDDPIIPAEDLARLAPNPLLRIVRTRHGGHTGFLSSWRGESWSNAFVMRELASALD